MKILEQIEEAAIRGLRIQTPAKINLMLRVLGKRADGYHELESIMVPLSLFDELRILLNPETKGIGLDVAGGPLGLTQENLAYRGAEAFLKAYGKNLPGIEIHLTKNIPVAAGLGGGSSDAAAVLLALNHLCGRPLSVQKLMQIGQTLGADVPFFIEARPALARGLGEDLRALAYCPNHWYVLVNPGISISTPWVYGQLNRQPGELFERNSDEILEGWLNQDVLDCLLQNDLESVTLNAYPELTEIKEKLVAMGAKGALMSGSGPTVFGVFTGPEAEKQSIKALHQFEEDPQSQRESWKIFRAHCLLESN